MTTSEKTDPLVELKDLNVSYDQSLILRAINMELPSNSVISLLG